MSEIGLKHFKSSEISLNFLQFRDFVRISAGRWPQHFRKCKQDDLSRTDDRTFAHFSGQFSVILTGKYFDEYEIAQNVYRYDIKN